MDYENCQSAWIPGFGKRYAIYYQDEPLDAEVWSFWERSVNDKGQFTSVLRDTPQSQISIQVNPRGYPFFFLGPAGQQEDIRLHRLLYRVFKGPIPKGLHVLHRDDNKLNYRLDNLYAGTDEDNYRDACRNGTHSRPPRWNRGQVRLMVTLRKCGWSNARIGRLLGSNPVTVGRVFLGKLVSYARWIKQMR